MKSKNVVQLHEVNTHTKESIKTTRSKCGGLFVRIIIIIIIIVIITLMIV